VETKFRLSPVIEDAFSQRLEGRDREKIRKGDEFPNKKSDRVTRSMESRQEDTSILSVKGKGVLHEGNRNQRAEGTKPASNLLPYVDVPPIRPTIRPMAVTADGQDQSDRREKPLDREHRTDRRDDPVAGRPAYKARAPVETGLDIEKIVESVLDLEINLPLWNLAGISVAIQKEIKKQMTKTRQGQVDDLATINCLEEQKQFINIAKIPVPCMTTMEDVSDEIPEGHLVANDPALQYLIENQEAKSTDLVVAKSSEPLRSIYAIINGVGQEECLIDNGSSIVSMAKEEAVQKGLTWDPNLKINMESATNHVVETLGLARNVCFRIGGINVYLQVHILEKPPYKILLGRPFDAFTASVVRTASDGSSELVLTDPNTGIVSVIPTYKRGEGPEELRKKGRQGF
jgi:hypothetical protein